MGKAVYNTTDKILQEIGVLKSNNEDTLTLLARMPITRAFFTETPLGSRGQSVQKFYEKLDQLESASRTVNAYIREENIDGLQKLLAEREKDYKWYLENQTQINKFREVLKATRSTRVSILEDETIKNKREVITALEKRITDVAIIFNNAYEKGKFFDIGEYMSSVLEDYREEKKSQKEKIDDVKEKYAPKKKSSGRFNGIEKPNFKVKL